ncbi:carbohydrate sulfotransferase 15 isoform X2 [Magallana gigas]|uniref:carbohydrate sulfotransferase 15 isoform X2 n=1 Tax=Magallana gigas TaxID=29159 RepID=UPI00333F317F
MPLKLCSKWRRILFTKCCKRNCPVIISGIICVLIVFHIFLRTRLEDFLHPRSARWEHQCGQQQKRINSPEDLLCQERKKFLPNFKNPCWYDFTGNNSSNRLRCLPYFHIIGVCKSGTTDLFYRLVQHPQIVKNRGLMSKETWFWSWHRYGTELWRKGHADPMDFWDHTLWWLIPQNNGNASEPVFTTPHLIHHVQPNIKLILLLREPAERLYSHYYHLGYGSSPEDFKVDVSASIRYLDRCRAKSSLRSCLYNRTLFKEMPTPLFASFYDVHMANWLEVFPRNQIFIMRTEDFDKSKKKYLLQLFKFLNVGDVEERVLDRMSNLAHKYKSVRKDKAGPMLNHTRQTLRDYLREPMKRLASLLHDEKYTWDDIYIGN